MPGKESLCSFRHPASAVLSSILFTAFIFVSVPAYALTDFVKPKAEQSKDNTGEPAADPDSGEDEHLDDAKPGMPMPESLIKKPGQAEQDVEPDSEDKVEQPDIPAEIIYDMSRLPEPVKKMRIAIVEAAASGDIERLRPLLGSGENATQVAVGDAPEDPIAALKSLSGDKEGREVLGILLDIISTSAALVDKGTPNETYVWPYFAEKKLDSLSPPEIVELYRIVTAADVADMKEFGSYNFYRIGITPQGKWRFFVAGD